MVIARPDSYADALAGGPLAAALDAPILLARDTDDLDDGVLDEIQGLGADTVIILGGEAAVLPEVEDALEEGRSVTRIGGGGSVRDRASHRHTPGGRGRRHRGRDRQGSRCS